jgi:ComF family protein
LTSTLRRRLFSWGKIAEVLLFPSFCELCHAFLEKPGEKIICSPCSDKLEPSSSSYCLSCGRFFEGAGEPHLCGACLDSRPPFSKHRSCARYEGVVKDVILLFKYRGFEVLGQTLGDFMFLTLGKEEDLWSGLDAIIPVPLHPKKEKKRGFNQSRILAKRLAEQKKIALVDKQLIKLRNSPAQTSLEGRERAKNVKGAFQVRNSGELKGKTVLLVDDVYTTGSTLRECSLALKKAGVEEIRAVTIAQA